MPLTLRILSYRKQAPAVPVERRFDHLGGTIGRGAGNDLELPDPAKYISRNHATVGFAEGRYTLMDLGANASWINDRPVGTGKTAPLAHGDRLLIGDYELEATIDEAAPARVVSDLAPVTAPEASGAPPFQPQPANISVTSPQAGGSFDALRDTLAGERILNAPVAPPPAEPPSGSGLAAPSAADPLGLGLLAGGAPAPVITAAEPSFRGSEPDHVAPQFMPMDGSLMPRPVPQPVALAPLDQTILTTVAAALAARPPAPSTPPAPPAPAALPPQAGHPAPAGSLIPDDYDPLADFLPPSRAAASASTPTSAPAPAYTAYQPPAAPVQPAPVQAWQAPAGQGDEVLQALLRGLGLPQLRTVKTPVETAELAGALLREAVAGTMSVLLARAMTKRETRVDVTVLGAQANNPLKFFPDAESALGQMLTGAMGGYLPPVKSIGSAFDDLRAH